MLLQQKNIVITVCTICIGLSAETAFVSEGANIVLVCRNEDSCTAAKALLGNAVSVYSGKAIDPKTASFSIAALQNKINDAISSLLVCLREASIVLLKLYTKLTFPFILATKIERFTYMGKLFISK